MAGDDWEAGRVCATEEEARELCRKRAQVNEEINLRARDENLCFSLQPGKAPPLSQRYVIPVHFYQAILGGVNSAR